MNGQDRFWCVVPAAGRGRRFGDALPKQYIDIGGRRLIEWTLSAIGAHPRVAGLVVVLAQDDPYWIEPEGIEVPLLTTRGGAERADSVLSGLLALPCDVAGDDFVLVHDAARPCVRDIDIEALVTRVVGSDGGLLAAPLRDTLKRGDDDQRVVATEPRESRWRALTPQMFRRDALTRALREAAAAGIAMTDEAMAMERAGHRPLLVEGSDDNIKVTTPADAALAAFLLRQRPGHF